MPLLAVAALHQSDGSALVHLSEAMSARFVPDGMMSTAVFNILPFLVMIPISYDAFMRFQAARSGGVARSGAIIGGFVVLGVSFFAALTGAIGHGLLPDVPAATVLPEMIMSGLPPILGGIVLAALLAAAMSTANSLMLSMAGTFSRDLYNKVLHPDEPLDDLPHARIISQVAIVLTVAIGVVVALHAQGILYTMIVFNLPYMASMLVPLLGGILWPRAHKSAAYAAMFSGGAIGLVSFVVAMPGPLHGLFSVDWSLAIAYLVSGVVFVVVTLAKPEPPESPDSALARQS